MELETWYLENTNAGHHKGYKICVEPAPNNSEIVTIAYWGRIGNLISNQVKYTGNTAGAVATAQALVQQKEAKGYVLVDHKVYNTQGEEEGKHTYTERKTKIEEPVEIEEGSDSVTLIF